MSAKAKAFLNSPLGSSVMSAVLMIVVVIGRDWLVTHDDRAAIKQEIALLRQDILGKLSTVEDARKKLETADGEQLRQIQSVSVNVQALAVEVGKIQERSGALSDRLSKLEATPKGSGLN